MATDMPTSTGLPRRWREETAGAATLLPPGKAGYRAGKVVLILAFIFGLLAALGGVLSWLKPGPSPYCLPLCISAYQSRSIPPVPMGERDLEALRAAGIFARMNNVTPAHQEGHVVLQELAHLSDREPKDAVVVYVSGHAVLAGAGKIHILPADASPDNPATWIPLEDLLKRLRACPARNQLLVLDIMKPVPAMRLGAFYHDIAGALPAELEAVPDARRLVLAACAPGQTALVSEELNRSVFSYYLEEGLRGGADGYSSTGSRDGFITVQELAAFVRARVDRWAQRTRGARQVPVLHGQGADFALAATHGEPRARPTPGPDLAYPEYLKDAWTQRDTWWREGSYRFAPRAFQQAQAILLEMENDWRGGVSELHLQKQRAFFSRAHSELLRQKSLFQPVAVSLAQEEFAGTKAEEGIKQAFQELMDGLHEQLAGLEVEGAEKLKTKLIAGFHARMKDRSDHDLEAAVFAWTAAQPRLEPGTVRFLGHVGSRAPQAPPRYAETLLVRQLADLAYRVEGKDWPAPLVTRVIDLCRKGEQAAADPLTLPWVQGLLDDAAQARHGAEVRLWARGYASLEDAEALVKSAEEQYRTIAQHAAQVRQAHAALEEACALLSFYPPYLEAVPAQEKSWVQAALAAAELATALAAPPIRPSPKNERHADARAKLLNIERLTKRLAEPMTALKRPFAADNRARLDKLVRLTRPGPAVLLEVEALLSVPAPDLTADDRVALWTTVRAVARKLHEETVQLDRDDDLAGRITVPPDPFPVEAAQEEAARARRRVTATLALLDLGGLAPERLVPARGLVDRLGQQEATLGDWCVLGTMTRHLWSNQLPAHYDQDNISRVGLSWIAPPLDSVKCIDEAELSAAALARLQQVRGQWLWLSDHYRYLARDYDGLGLTGPGPKAAQQFYARAAVANQELAGLKTEAYPLIQDTATLPVALSGQSPVETTLAMRRVLPAGAYGPVDLAISLPDRAWLEVTPDAVRLGGVSDSAQPREIVSKVPVQIALRPGAERSSKPRPAGFLAQVRFEGRAYHAVVPVRVQTAPQEVHVLVSTNPVEPSAPVSEIRLRPNRRPQNYYVYLKNLRPRVRRVQLEILVGDTPVQGGKLVTTLNPEETQRLNLGEAALPKDGFPEAQGTLILRASDAETTNLLDQKYLRLEIAAPRDYVRLADIQYDPPGAGSDRNKLQVRLQCFANVPGPSIPVELVLPQKRIPGFQGVDGGTLQGELVPKDRDALVTLFAEGIRRSGLADEEGPVYLNVDGLERAFTFRTPFARGGPALTPRAETAPAVRWDVAPFVPAGLGVAFPIEVDNAPPGTSLEVSLGRGEGAAFEADLSMRFPQAKQRRIGFWPHGKDGALTFEASMTDWPLVWNTSRIIGARVLRARLLDEHGKELARAVQNVAIDADAPGTARIVDLPVKAKRGAALKLRAEAGDNESGIAQVVFFVGQPHEGGKIPAATPTVAATPLDGKKTTWSATVPLPDRTGPTAVSIAVTNGIGLTRYGSATLELTETDPMAVDPKGPGKIVGRVLEGTRVQPGLEVILRDAAGKEHARTRTKSDGSYSFENVAPGSYVLHCVKPESLRRATSAVIVEPNGTATRDLTLSL